MKKYIPKEIEKKWQEKWKKDNLYKIDLQKAQNPYYLLVELPYSSGDLHIGHWFTFGVNDIFGRFKRMQGFDVFYPIGFDAFGLPAENAAIKRGLHPKDWTLKNVKTMTQQFQLMGGIFDLTDTVITCLPEYYKWNQWIFLKMLEKGVAYRGTKLSNWCPVDQTVLADEQVINGRCERCGAEVVQKEISQWLLKITNYAEKLEWDGTEKIDWPKSVVEGQNKWIGRSQGVQLKFPISNSQFANSLKTENFLEVYTTRPDTLFGVTFMVISPEHPLVNDLVTTEQETEVRNYVREVGKKSEQERKENKQKTGVFTGSYAVNPMNGEKIPIWVADYVLLSYGTGAIMAVPAHDERDFEFAKKFNLAITEVIKNPEGENNLPYKEEGKLVNSGQFDGLPSAEAREKITAYLEQEKIGVSKIQYHLHDWSISRQRYWGTPIPIINCESCGSVPVPYEDLPVELPYEVDFKPKGKPPLATAEEWMKVKCPKCGGEATREPETMDGFVDNSWYMYRYLSPHNDQTAFDKDLTEKWMPVDIYFGGAEHILGHTLYSRFFTKFFHDLELTSFDEYALKRVNHGVILGPDGSRMSKSRGNVINPDELVPEYGADAVRTYLAFIGPYDIVAPWNPGGINGVYHFYQRVWALLSKVDNTASEIGREDMTVMYRVIKKVGEDIDLIKLNTAVAALMEWLNYLSKKEKISHQEYSTFLKLLAPFAPHLTEELWQMLGENYSIHQQKWPDIKSEFLEDELVNLAVQVNGRIRDVMTFSSQMNKSDIERHILKNPKIKKFLGQNEPRKIIFVPGKIFNIVT
jgi:leucyl-tRNA synthetase